MCCHGHHSHITTIKAIKVLPSNKGVKIAIHSSHIIIFHIQYQIISGDLTVFGYLVSCMGKILTQPHDYLCRHLLTLKKSWLLFCS